MENIKLGDLYLSKKESANIIDFLCFLYKVFFFFSYKQTKNTK